MRTPKRTKTELKVAEVIATFYKKTKDGLILDMGEKPCYFPKNAVSSMRDYNSLLSRYNKTNPIIEAKKLKQFIDEHPAISYSFISEATKLSKARISQVLSLLKNIPSDITDCIEQQSDPDFLCFFTERKLRELTKLTTDSEKQDAFRKKIDSFNEKNNVSLVF